MSEVRVKRTSTSQLLDKIESIQTSIELQLPDTEFRMSDVQYTRSIWSESELDLLKTKLLDLTQNL